MENITKAPVVAQVDQVLSVLGDDRLTVPVDALCNSAYFAAKDGATFDTRYFTETYFPKLAEAVWPDRHPPH